MSTVLFLDLALHTGWACDDPHDAARPMTGIATLPEPVDGRCGHTLSIFEAWCVAMVERVQPVRVAYEAPVLLPRESNFVLIALAGVVEMVCHRHGIPYRKLYNATIKKAFTGSGKAKKIDIIVECERRGWVVGCDDNRADAAAGWWLMKTLASLAKVA